MRVDWTLMNEVLRLTNNVFNAIIELRSYLVMSTVIDRPFGLNVVPPKIKVNTPEVITSY